MVFPDLTINIPVGRYEELIKAERDGIRLKAFLDGKFKRYAGISHSDLEMLHSMGLIEGGKDDTDT